MEFQLKYVELACIVVEFIKTIRILTEQKNQQWENWLIGLLIVIKF